MVWQAWAALAASKEQTVWAGALLATNLLVVNLLATNLLAANLLAANLLATDLLAANLLAMSVLAVCREMGRTRASAVAAVSVAAAVTGQMLQRLECAVLEPPPPAGAARAPGGWIPPAAEPRLDGAVGAPKSSTSGILGAGVAAELPELAPAGAAAAGTRSLPV